MKKIFILLSLLSLLFYGCLEEKKQGFTIVASNYPIYEFTKNIAKDDNVILLLPKGVNGHYYEPSPRDVETIANADVFIYSGALETWVNRTLQAIKGPKIIKAGKKVAEIDEDLGGKKIKDPHIWLSPKNAILEIEVIKSGLIEANPEKKEEYERNAEEYLKKLKELDNAYEKLKQCKKHEVIVTHKCLAYPAEHYGFEQVPIINNFDPNEGDISIKYMNGIVSRAKKDNITIVLYENYLNPKIAEVLGNEIGARLEKINSMETYNDQELEDSYIGIMYKNLEAIEHALECKNG